MRFLTIIERGAKSHTCVFFLKGGGGKTVRMRFVVSLYSCRGAGTIFQLEKFHFFKDIFYLNPILQNTSGLEGTFEIVLIILIFLLHPTKKMFFWN